MEATADASCWPQSFSSYPLKAGRVVAHTALFNEGSWPDRGNPFTFITYLRLSKWTQQNSVLQIVSGPDRNVKPRYARRCECFCVDYSEVQACRTNLYPLPTHQKHTHLYRSGKGVQELLKNVNGSSETETTNTRNPHWAQIRFRVCFLN